MGALLRFGSVHGNASSLLSLKVMLPEKPEAGHPLVGKRRVMAGGVQALDICLQIKDEKGVILGQRTLDLILATPLSSTFLLPFFSLPRNGTSPSPTPGLLEGPGG
ncbi:Diacylglycerol Kinase Gamma [Manis pentadactyla]|nr:Diacylglycerol Kinase Gamma [Manis pentadactyla]